MNVHMNVCLYVYEYTYEQALVIIIVVYWKPYKVSRCELEWVF